MPELVICLFFNEKNLPSQLLNFYDQRLLAGITDKVTKTHHTQNNAVVSDKLSNKVGYI